MIKLFGALAGLALLLATTACEEELGTDGAPTGAQDAAAAATTAAPTLPRVGDTALVGDLDLQILEVVPFDSRVYNQFNEANIAVKLTATNARGRESGTYTFTPVLALRLVDSAGVVHEPTFLCAGCPDVIDSLELIRGGSASGAVYFEAPEGVGLVELRYQAFLSTNKVTFALR